jgi:hypothetical protein
MAPDRIRQVIGTLPFRPFTVELGSGKRVPVNHPEYVSLSPAGRTLVVYDDHDAMEIIDVFLITNISVEGVDPATIQ